MPTRIDRDTIKRFRSTAYAGRDHVAAALAEVAMDRSASAVDCIRLMSPEEERIFRSLCPNEHARQVAEHVIGHWLTRRYSSDGDTEHPWSVADFREVNREDGSFQEMAAQVYALDVGESVTLGGGAFAETRITRIS